MKTLKREDLDELARIMPVLSGDSTSRPGGEKNAFYDFSGNFLKEVGSGGAIRVITSGNLEDEIQKAKDNDDPGYKNSMNWGVSIKEAMLKNEQITKIFNNILGEDMSTKFAEGITYSSGTGDLARIMMYEQDGEATTFGLEIDLAGISVEKVLYFRSIYYHEDIHRQNPSIQDWAGEDNAYTEQTSQPGFKSLDIEFRLKIQGAWLLECKKGNSGNVPPKDLERINKACGF